MEFQVLGPVGATVGPHHVEIGTPRQRCVLAVLLTEVGQVVSADQLIDRVWDQAPPREARSTLYSYVTRIRTVLQSLGTEADGVALVRHTGGYVLEAPPDRVDLHRFRQLVKQARAAEDERSSALLNEALALWRADALTGVSGAWAERTRAQLDDERVTASLLYQDVQLSLGRHEELLPGLHDLVASHPFDERLTARLMTVLERCGRQAEALRLYERIRSQLAEQLGVDPGPELRARHLEVLSSVSEPSGLAIAAAPLVSRQLPLPPTGFEGRDRELADLDRMAEQDEGVILALVGTGGVGKTYLALNWAHLRLNRFPDGQLYANLKGFNPAGEHVSTSTALRGFLEALGVEPAAIPFDDDARSALYRSLVAGRRLLIVLDDVREPADVIPLLPGSATCTVLVTSRNRLDGLVVTHGARVLALEVLSPAEAHRMLARKLGADRVSAEAATVRVLLEHCGGLPLALGILASRATAHSEFPLALLAEELKEESSRLDALDVGGASTDVRAVFASSYRALTPHAAWAFGLLGLAPGSGISLSAATALLTMPISRARSVLRTLEAAHLVHQYAPQRYRMHDLVRLYAMEVAERDVPAHERDAALRRLTEFYFHSAYAADRVLYPHRLDLKWARPDDGGFALEPIRETAEALAWFDAEYSSLLATHRLTVARGWDIATWQLAWALDTYCWRRSHRADRLSMWKAAFEAAERLAEPGLRAMAHWRLGFARAHAGERDQVLDLLHRALSMFTEMRETAFQAQVHQSLGWVLSQQGEHGLSLHHAECALALYQGLANPAWEANALNAVAWCLAQLDRHEHALVRCEQALALFRKGDDPDGEAATLDSMGYIAHHMGEHREAIAFYRSAVRLRNATGNATQEPDTLVRIGEAHAALGEATHARQAWERAASLYRGQRRLKEAERVQARLDAGPPGTERAPS
ncbi:BTAD domain-containing putative transcriptional regulator [Nonomuraea sp. NPDC050451]|uniref:AfsR/SARP family transcriptional regulator n=1 Tax=Nonomuraea sp. NPDC050451 TaxID=3364364 RepID=UPI0037BA5716